MRRPTGASVDAQKEKCCLTTAAPRRTEIKPRGMRDQDHGQQLIDAWHTSHRVTMYLIENLPPEL